MKKKIAVYGSLLSEMYNHDLLNNDESTLLGEDIIDDNFTLVAVCSYPGLIQHEGGNTPVKMEIYEVSDEIYANVERLEGYPNYYDKLKIDTKFGEAEVYVLGEEYLSRPKVEDGDWRKYYNENYR